MPCGKITTHPDFDIAPYKPLFDSFFPYAKKALGYTTSPKLNFASDIENSSKPLGKTAYYRPDTYEITIYTDGRHIKDILRSISHELVHHTQNDRGDLDGEHDTSPGYYLEGGHMAEMEEEAFLEGNRVFRMWEDNYKYRQEENKMSKLMDLIREELKGVLSETKATPSAVDCYKLDDGRPRMRCFAQQHDQYNRANPGNELEYGAFVAGYKEKYSPESAAKKAAADAESAVRKRRELFRKRRSARITKFQQALQDSGHTDYEGKQIADDGALGRRTATAYASLVPAVSGMPWRKIVRKLRRQLSTKRGLDSLLGTVKRYAAVRGKETPAQRATASKGRTISVPTAEVEAEIQKMLQATGRKEEEVDPLEYSRIKARAEAIVAGKMANKDPKYRPLADKLMKQAAAVSLAAKRQARTVYKENTLSEMIKEEIIKQLKKEKK